MNRHALPRTLSLFAAAAMALSPLAATAKKPPPAAAPTMTFDEPAAPEPAKMPPKKGVPSPAPAAKANATMSFGESAAGAKEGGPASKTLERAIKLYDTEDYYSASIELNKVVEKQTSDDEANQQRAEFYMGKTLFKMRFYSASLSYFDRIVQKGTGHRYYNKTLE